MNTGAQAADPVRGRRAHLVAAALAAAAAVCAGVGSALPLFTVKINSGDNYEAMVMELTMTSWGMEAAGGLTFGDLPHNGYPLVFAAIVLVCGAIWCRSATRPGARPRTRRLAGVIVVAGGAFLACAVWMVALQVANWSETYDPPDDGPFRMDAESSYLGGVWVLTVAALLGVAAIVPALWPVPEPVALPAPAVDPDAPTPPFGITLPIQVDPLTGELLDQLPLDPESLENESLEHEPPSLPPPVAEPAPIVIPDAPPAPATPPGPAVPTVEDPLAEPRRD